MNDYTPTTEEVREHYLEPGGYALDPSRVGAEFDRWLAREQSNTLQEFRARLIENQKARYGIVLPDVREIVDDRATAADELDPT